MKITIPTPGELRGELDGIEGLLTAKKWARAAIVYAYTEVQTNKGHGNRPGVTPPKMNIRTFAAQNYAGLSTPKAVSRYREAWLTAVSQGWAPVVEPGTTVILPDQPFPPWPYGEGSTWEDTNPAAIPEAPRGRGPNKPFTARAVVILESAANSLRQLAAMDFSSDELEPEDRDQLVESLRLVRDRADEALRSLEGVPA